MDAGEVRRGGATSKMNGVNCVPKMTLVQFNSFFLWICVFESRNFEHLNSQTVDVYVGTEWNVS